ncbi:MAG TPA: hypothetical protein VG826_05385 [Pirellulales bacterium]|nr:hypothetical protein [Pirellulales bacterium]
MARPHKDREPPEGRPQWRVFELIDDEGLPRYVGAGDWRRLWANRDKSGSRLAAWFRELAAAGREPVESNRWVLSMLVDGRTARAIARGRVRQIIQWAGGEHPRWLLTPRPTGKRRAVARRRQDGTHERFISVSQAGRLTATDRRTIQRRLADGCSDSAGNSWCYDFDGRSD